MKSALITGTGMDSHCLSHFLLSKGYHVFVATRRNTIFDFDSFKKNFDSDLIKYPNSKLSVLYADVSDSESVSSCIEDILKEVGSLDEIYHLAATSHVAYSYATPSLNVHTNGMSALYFLDSIKKNCPKTKFYFAATTELFSGNVSDKKYTEESKFHPKTPYAVSKAMGFHWTQYYRETYGIFAVSGILANHSCCERHPSFFIKKITSAAAKIATGKEREVHIGHLEWARDEMWADFAMEAAWKMLQLEAPEDFIVGNGNCKWGEEYVEKAFGHFNLKWQDYVKFDSQFLRKNEVVKLEVSPEKAIKTLDWKVERMPFADHVRLMCEFDYSLESGLKPIRPDVFKLYP